MNSEEKYQEILDTLKVQMHKALDQSITDIHCELAPHFEDDRWGNVTRAAQEVVTKIIAGNFSRVDDEYVYVEDHSGMSCMLKISTYQYDNMRENLIKAMPKCPKDAKIASLEETIRYMQNSNSYRY